MKFKQLMVGAVLAMSAMSLVAEALAKPMGGGRSIGRQSQNVSRMAPQPAPAPNTVRPATPAQQPANGARAPAPAPAKPGLPWKGILGGALLGLGLGALFSHLGIGGAMASILSTLLMVALLGGAIYFIVRMIRGKSAGRSNGAPVSGFGGNPAPQGAGQTPEIGSGLSGVPPLPPLQPASGMFDKAVPPTASSSSTAAPHAQWGVPADFDSYAFLRHAKTNFIRLQAAWDRADVNDIREFTTPEVFAELKMQIQERGAQADYTDVVSLDAELLGIENNGTDYLASVKFVGSIKPAPTALAEPFHEVWNLSKPIDGSAGWMLAGIQQLSTN